MTDSKSSLLATYMELKDIFSDAARQGSGPAQPVFRRMGETAVAGLACAEALLGADREAESRKAACDAITLALDEERNIRTASGHDPAMQALFDDVAEKVTVKALDLLNFHKDVLESPAEKAPQKWTPLAAAPAPAKWNMN